MHRVSTAGQLAQPELFDNINMVRWGREVKPVEQPFRGYPSKNVCWQEKPSPPRERCGGADRVASVFRG